MKSIYTGIANDKSAVAEGHKLFGSDPVQNAKFDESKHPRAEDGKFGSGGGGGDTGSSSGGEKKGGNVTPIKKPSLKEASKELDSQIRGLEKRQAKHKEGSDEYTKLSKEKTALLRKHEKDYPLKKPKGDNDPDDLGLASKPSKT